MRQLPKTVATGNRPQLDCITVVHRVAEGRKVGSPLARLIEIIRPTRQESHVSDVDAMCWIVSMGIVGGRFCPEWLN